MIDPINTWGEKEFDKKLHEKYLKHIDINNLKGMEIENIYNWKLGETLIVTEHTYIVLLQIL